MHATTEPPAAEAPAPRPRRRALALGGAAVLVAVVALLSGTLRGGRPAPAPLSPEQAELRRLTAQVAARPDDASAHLELGRFQEQRGYVTAAVEQLRLAQQGGASVAETSGLLGRCLARLNRFEEAERELKRAAEEEPESATTAVDLARLYVETDRPERARATLSAFLSRHRDLAHGASSQQKDAVKSLMVAFGNIGAHKETLALARQYMFVAPQDPLGYGVTARELLVQGKAAEAVEIMERAIEVAPHAAAYRVLYGRALGRLPGRIGDAMEQLNQAISEDPQSASAHLALANEYAKRKAWKEAALATLKATNLGDGGPLLFAKAADLARKAGLYTESTYCRAQAANLATDHARALAEYQVVARSLKPFWQARGLDGAAKCALALRRIPEYLKLIEKATAGGTGQDWLHRAEGYAAVNDPREEDCLRQALAKDATLAPMVHSRLGRLAEGHARWDQAEAEYLAAIKAEPGNPAHHQALARVYLSRRDLGDRPARAVAAARRATELKPDDAAGFSLLGRALAAAKDLPGAVTAFEHAIDLHPDDAGAYLDLGNTLNDLGDRKRAAEILGLYRKQAALELRKRNLATRSQARPDDPALLVALGDLLAQTHDYDQAVQKYQRAVFLRPANADWRRKLAESYRRTGRTGEAAELDRQAGQGVQG
jgi:tetratricopeptide (TPR) repeat protein